GRSLSRRCTDLHTHRGNQAVGQVRESRKVGAVPFLKPMRQVIESVNNILKVRLDLERHGGRTVAGVCTRIAQRLLALTAAI
ncbi:hypothetical protein RCG71_19310, partial [Kocuria sp. CPCC 205281]